MKPLHVNITISAVLGAIASMAVSLTALSAPLHTLFGVQADKIISIAAIVSALLATVAGVGKSPLPPQSPIPTLASEKVDPK